MHALSPFLIISLDLIATPLSLSLILLSRMWSHADSRSNFLFSFFFFSQRNISSDSHAFLVNKKSCMCFFIYSMRADCNHLLCFSSLPLGADWPFPSVSPDLLLLLLALCSFHHLALLPSSPSTLADMQRSFTAVLSHVI